MGFRRLVSRLILALTLAVAMQLIAPTAPAQAWPWDPHVTVLGSVSSCGPSNTNGWGWYSSDTGESGWLRWGSGSTFTFDLWRVQSYGALVTIKWGAGTCSAVRYVVINRPIYGTSASVGYLG
jgi:hypothetical protein